MRIIGGARRRRALSTPAGLTTRPILDRVKQALFDALGAWYGAPGRLPPVRVLDLFCGGGTLGLEAMSRGAACCTFVDRDRAALACLRKNLAALDASESCVVRAGDARKVVIAPPAGGAFDLIFLDPPFPLSAAYAAGSELQRMVARFGADVPVAADALCIWRLDAQSPQSPAPPGWSMAQNRQYGRNRLIWLQRAGASDNQAAPTGPAAPTAVVAPDDHSTGPAPS